MARKALLIGINTYHDTALPNLINAVLDVEAVGSLLEDDEIGAFTSVVYLKDPTFHEGQRALAKFFGASVADDTLLVYFAGHGIKDIRGQLFFLFSDSEKQIPDGTAIPDTFLARQMDRARARQQLVILDCCFSGAFVANTRSSSRAEKVDFSTISAGTASTNPHTAKMILTSTDAIQYSWDKERGANGQDEPSAFRSALVQSLKEGKSDYGYVGVQTVEDMFESICQLMHTRDVEQAPQLLTRPGCHNGQYIIAYHQKILKKLKIAARSLFELETFVDADENVRLGAINSGETLIYQAKEPHAIQYHLVRMAVADDNRVVRAAALAALNKVAASGFFFARNKTSSGGYSTTEWLPGPFEWCDIPDGHISFRKRKIIYHVRAFRIAKFPITREQFDEFVDDKKGYFNPDCWRGLRVKHERPIKQKGIDVNLPRVFVSWYEAIAFCRWLSNRTGVFVRLPTEWEWEWAASSEYDGDYPWGDFFDAKRCNTRASDRQGLIGVDYIKMGDSQFGVSGMSGNIWERCLNLFYSPDNVSLAGEGYRVIRGGSWSYPARFAQVHHRHLCIPEKRFNDGGFRIASASSAL